MKEAEERILRLAMEEISAAPTESVVELKKKKRKNRCILSGIGLALVILVAASVGNITASAFIDGVILQGDVTEEYDGTWSRAIDGKYTMKGPFTRVIPVEEIIGITVNGKPLYFDRAETAVETSVVPEN